ncbi:DUF2771 family protein [Solihabitans fulvus]|uniref:DUF2771 family protein n=1 Tax=Solihabitans fulvus TaxID=1892852 RepID=A0A5B2XI94_9PSEU|nr:DUF2771 family protein [Solihabitans fulvus]KAA2262956.1 DUF2771 family protein [Solihabitans fulvus]
MRRGLTLLLAAGAGLVLAGCSAPDPDVTFYSSGKTVVVRPAQYCDLKSGQCATREDAPATLRVPAGRPLQISVPGEVANSTWAVVFSYRNANGEPQPDARSRIFRAGEQYAYTLNLPNPGDQLDHAEVQKIGVVDVDQTQGVQFVVVGSWVLDTQR